MVAFVKRIAYSFAMVIVRFPDIEMRRNALSFLLGRFPGKSWATGEVMVPEEALSHLAAEGFRFTVEGRATYERMAGWNSEAPPAVSNAKPATA
ncbi:MAG TPA: hypothetical protein VFT34_14755 [Verrucomicrobiae bacterium]|nr:hypothetical protein [Verrucomicrobiae bacterium]